MQSGPIRVAAAHVAPEYLDSARSLEKACTLVAEAAGNGARLIVFPEAWVPGFPLWNALRAPIHNHRFFERLAGAALRVPGPGLARLAQCARRHEILVSIGFTEGTEASRGCLWNSNLLIGADGSLLNHHRKLVPTFYEKLSWANGDGAGLRVVETPIGRVGALICGENTNPLARYALIAQGEEMHLASYPPLWPTHDPGDAARYELADAIRIRAAAHSFEAKCFTVVAAGCLGASARAALAELGEEAMRILEGSPHGASMVIDPMGRVVAGPVDGDDDLLLYAEVDVARCVVPKQFHDLSGGYNRFDVFQLGVDRRARRPARFIDEPAVAQESRGSGDGDVEGVQGPESGA